MNSSPFLRCMAVLVLLGFCMQSSSCTTVKVAEYREPGDLVREKQVSQEVVVDERVELEPLSSGIGVRVQKVVDMGVSVQKTYALHKTVVKAECPAGFNPVVIVVFPVAALVSLATWSTDSMNPALSPGTTICAEKCYKDPETEEDKCKCTDFSFSTYEKRMRKTVTKKETRITKTLRSPVTAGDVWVTIDGIAEQIPISKDGIAIVDMSGFRKLLKDRIKTRTPVTIAYAYQAATAVTTFGPHELEKVLASMKPSRLHITSVALEDRTTNRDQALDGEEKAELVVTLANKRGYGTAVDSYLSILSNNAGVELPARQKVGTLKPGVYKTVRIPVQGALDLKTGTATLVLTARDFGGNRSPEQTFQFQTSAIEVPALELVACRVQDIAGRALGNGNGISENGETVELLVTVRNNGKGDARGVTVSVADAGGAEVISRETLVGLIPSGSEETASLAIRFPDRFQPPADTVIANIDVADIRGFKGTSKGFPVSYRYNEPRVKLVKSEIVADRQTDGIPRQGDIVFLRVVLKNTGTRDATGVRVSVQRGNAGEFLERPEQIVGSLPKGATSRELTFPVVLKGNVSPGKSTLGIQVAQDTFPGSSQEIDYTILAMDTPQIINQPVLRQKAKNTGSGPKVPVTVSATMLTNLDLVPHTAKARPSAAYALVVGIGLYKNTHVEPAAFAAKDARKVREHLSRMGAFPEQNLTLLTNEAATRSDILVALQKILRQARARDTVFIYFAGHGIAVPEDGKTDFVPYLLPYDGDPHNPALTSLRVSELKHTIGEMASGKVMLVLDCCFSGTGRSVRMPGTRAMSIVVKDPVAAMPPAGSKVVMTACGPRQVSHEYKAKGYGLFTYFMLLGMRGAADVDADGWVSAKELFTYVKPQVAEEALKLGFVQTPEMAGRGEDILVTRAMSY